jgi:hypothetical protein
MEKPIQPKSAHQAQPLARARARAPSVPDRQTPPVGASPRTSSLPLSLSLLCGADLSAPLLFAHARSLSAPRSPPVSPSLTSRPRPRVLWPPLHAPAPLEPAPRSPTSPCSLTPLAKLSRPLSRPARATRQALSPLTEDRRRSTTVVEPSSRPFPR